jgi:hypothetical protein
MVFPVVEALTAWGIPVVLATGCDRTAVPALYQNLKNKHENRPNDPKWVSRNENAGQGLSTSRLISKIAPIRKIAKMMAPKMYEMTFPLTLGLCATATRNRNSGRTTVIPPSKMIVRVVLMSRPQFSDGPSMPSPLRNG